MAKFNLAKPLRETVRALAPVACSREVEELGLEDEVVERVEAFLSSLSPPTRSAALAAITALELGAVGRYGKRFSKLSFEKRDAFFGSWWHSPISPMHALAKGLKAMIANGYYDIPLVRQRLDYHPDRWIAKVAKQRLNSWSKEIDAHERELRQPNPLDLR